MAQHDGHRQRMKEKMLNHSEALVAHEVIETLLFYSIPRKNVNELAHKLLDRFGGSIRNMLDADASVLQSVDGIGENTACFLKTINRIVQFIDNEKHTNKRINSVFDAKERLVECFANANMEKFVIFFLGADDMIIGKTEFCSNSTNMVEIDLNEVGKLLLLHNPSSVLVAHNHLSGNPHPSIQDNVTTKRILTFLKLNDVAFYDHLIYSENKIYSYKRDGELDKMIDEIMSVIC